MTTGRTPIPTASPRSGASPPRAWLAALALLCAVWLAGCSTVNFAEVERDDVFAIAVQASLDGEHALAVRASEHYLQGTSPEDPRYDRALRLLAISAESLGLSYAASLWYFDIAQSRRDLEVVAEAVRGLERIIGSNPFDDNVLLQGFIATDDITGLPREEQAFIDYYQGLHSIQRGLTDWADKSFDAIPPSSPYRARADYVRAVRVLARRDLVTARGDLEAILELEVVPEDLRIDVMRSLARIAFEEKRFGDAITIYQSIRETAPDDPLLLLEMAWSHYYRGESRRALGLLLALDAPVYGDFIAPERFLLEALALRRLCQFEPARSAAVRLRSRHGDALADLHNGVPLQTSRALRAASGLRTGGKPVASFRRRVEAERRLVDELSDDLGPEFSARLVAIYDRGVQESARREDELLEQEMKELARELLSAEEGVRLILHELGIALLRGRRRTDNLDEADPFARATEGSPVLYNFDGEFWTDELDDLIVTIEDRCID